MASPSAAVAGGRSAPDPGLAAKLAFLRDGRHLPGRPAVVETIETHLSWVFLTPGRVYKLKKPLRYPYLDFSSLSARRANCEAELRLNRPLAPGIYLEVRPLTADAQGRLGWSRRLPPVEYLVVMRRLAEPRNLRWQLSQAGPDPVQVRLAADKLMRFYLHSADFGPCSAQVLRQRVEASAAELTELLPATAAAAVSLRAALLSRIDACAPLLRRRRRRECHGDLRPQHVYLGPRPVLIDRLEFSAELRRRDPLEELAFFELECRRLGGAWVGESFLSAYRLRVEPAPPEALYRLYQAEQGLLWALLAARHLQRPSAPVEWAARAFRYLELASVAL